jgi:hypothetical protein
MATRPVKLEVAQLSGASGQIVIRDGIPVIQIPARTFANPSVSSQLLTLRHELAHYQVYERLVKALGPDDALKLFNKVAKNRSSVAYAMEELEVEYRALLELKKADLLDLETTISSFRYLEGEIRKVEARIFEAKQLDQPVPAEVTQAFGSEEGFKAWARRIRALRQNLESRLPRKTP